MKLFEPMDDALRMKEDLRDNYTIEYASDALEQSDALEEAALLDALRIEEAELLSREESGDVSPEGFFSDAADEVYEDEPSEKRLRRDVQRDALRRLEDAARSEADFRNVVSWWDRLDANRERRERYHEVSRDESLVPLDWNAKEDGIVFPTKYNTFLWKQMMKGDFLDVIFNCPLEIHELTSDENLYPILRDLKDDHKEIFYYLFIRLFSTALVGKIRGQSDRNIRKVRTTVLKKIRKKYAAALKAYIANLANKSKMTKEQREFLNEMGDLLDSKRIDH